jgi:hypothetical protein
MKTRTTASGANWFSADGRHWFASPKAAILAAAKAACERARWPEQHRSDCAWCATWRKS